MLKADGILCIDFNFQGEEHHILPVFTSPDAAVMFSGDLKHDGEAIHLTHIDSISKISDIQHLLNDSEIELVVLDPPNLDSEEPNIDMIHWSSNEFVELINSLIEISEKHDEKKAIDALDTYIHSIRNGEDPPMLDV